MELNQAFVGQKVAYRGQQHEIHALGTTPSGGGLAWLQGVTSPAPLCDVEPMLEHVPLFVQAERQSVMEVKLPQEVYQQGTFKKHLMAEMGDAHEDQFVNLPRSIRQELAGEFHRSHLQFIAQQSFTPVPGSTFSATICPERAREAIYESKDWDAIVHLVGLWTQTGDPAFGALLLQTLAAAITEYHAPAIQRIIDGEKL